MEETNSYISIMIDGLEKKVSVLNQIMDCTKQESRLLTSEESDLDELRICLDQKAGLTEQLDKLDTGFSALFERVKESLQNHKERYREQIKQMQSLIGEITELSVSISSRESRNKSLAEKKFTGMKREIRNAKHSGKTVSNYYKTMSAPDDRPQFIDKKE